MPEPSMPALKASTRWASIGIGRPRRTTILPPFGHALLEVFGRHRAEARIVAGHIEVFDARLAELAVDHRHPLAGILDLLDRGGHRVRIARQDDERVDIAGRHHVLEIGGLLGRIGRRLEHEFEVRIGLGQTVDRLLGEKVDAAGPAMVGGRHRNADRVGSPAARAGAASPRLPATAAAIAAYLTNFISH